MYVRPHRRQRRTLNTLARRVVYNTMTMTMQQLQQTATLSSHLPILLSVHKHDISDRLEYGIQYINSKYWYHPIY